MRDEAELQDQLMRFEGRFTARLLAAFKPLIEEAPEPGVRSAASRDLLSFMAAALDIAVGSVPDVDVLDMVTLVTLGRDAMARRWSGEAHGEAGRSVARAFEASLDDVAAIARRAFPESVEADLRSVIREWQEENPEVEDVASVRLSAHADNLDVASPKLAKHTAGLFSFVRGAARTADTAVLLGERALYAAQRLPFHVRIHARIATADLVSDVRRGILESSRDGSAIQRADELAIHTRRWVKKNLWSAAVACSSVVVVAAAAWLFARVAYNRISAR